MSYIVAFVRFLNSESLYPVSCWRTDIKEGDAVIVRMTSRGSALKLARVAYLAFYNWDCTNWIECLSTEATVTRDKIVLPELSRTHQGVSGPADVWSVIRDYGWRLHQVGSRSYKLACSARNASSVCYLFFRKNGVDVQTIDLANAPATDYDVLSFEPTVGYVSREDCRNTDSNFYAYICELAKAFSENRDRIDVKRPSQITRSIPWTGVPKAEQDTNWRDAFKDTNGYLQDGQWLGRS